MAHVATLDLTHLVLLMPQLRRLRDEGYEVTAISRPGPRVAEIEAQGIRHLPWPHIGRAWSPGEDARAYRALSEILRRERFDLVHTHNPKPGVMGRVAARLAGVRCVINTVHGLYTTPEDPVLRRIPVLAAERLAARFSDLELYQSEEDLRWARRIGLVDPGRSALLGNGVDLARFDPSEERGDRLAAMREELGIAPQAPVVGTVGRLVAEKGYPEFVAAAREIARVLPEARFLAVGPGDPAKWDAFGRSEVAGAAGSVVFAGWREDLPDLLALMDVFVLASRREGLPRSAIEAAAMGRSMVLTDIRGCREVARHRREALLVPPKDPGALTRAAVELLDDEDLRRRLGRAARSRAVERFDERRVADRLVGHYRDVLAAAGVTGKPVELDGLGTILIRHARPADVSTMARLHRETHPDAFLPTLGDGFLRQLYLAHVRDPDAVALVAERDSRVIGYTTGLLSTPRFRRRFVKRFGLQASLAAAPRLLNPGRLRRGIELIRYPEKVSGLPQAEWTVIALDPRVSARGLGTLLGRSVIDELARRGAPAIKTFVALDNEPSNRMVLRIGFQPRGEVSIHDGVASNLYVLRCRSS